MNRRFSRLVAIALVSAAFSSTTLIAQNNTDEAAVKKLVEQLFVSHQKKDLDGAMACWSAKSPLFIAYKRYLENDFVNSEETQFLNITLTRLKTETDQAFARLRYDTKWRDAKTKQPDQQTVIFDVQFAKEANEWKLWQLSDTVNNLARRLVAAERKDERAELLKDEKDAVTLELVRVLGNAGIMQASQGKFNEALRLNDISLEVAGVFGEIIGNAHCYWSRGQIFYKQSKYLQALENLQHALRLFQEAKDKRWEAWTLMKLGQIYEGTSKYMAAMAQYEMSLKIMLDIGNKDGEAAAHDSIGNVYLLRAKHTEALAQYEASLKITRDIDDKEDEAKTLSNIGNVYQATGKYAEALARYEASLKIERELGNTEDEAKTLNNIGVVYQLTGEYTEALTRFEASLKIKRDIRDRLGEAGSLANIGLVYQATGKYIEALAQFEAALKIMRDIGNRAVEAKMLNNIGNVYQATGRYAEAVAQYEASLNITRDIGDRVGEANALGNIGLIYQSTGRYAEALTRFEATLGINRDTGDRTGEASTLNNIGNVYQLTGRYAEALTRFEAALKIMHDIGNRVGEASMLNNIGLVYRLIGEPTKALAQHKAGLKIMRDIGDKAGEAIALNNIGNVHRLTSRYADALTQYEMSLKIKRDIGDRVGEANALGNIGNVYQLTGRYAEAVAQYEASLNITRDIGDRVGTITSLANIAVVYRSQKQWQRAADSYRQAIQLIELTRTKTKEPSLQTGFFARYISPYHGLVESLLELGSSPDEVLTVSERAKARTLVDLMAGNMVSVLKSMTDTQRMREQELNANIIATTLQLNNALAVPAVDRGRVEGLRKQINAARDEYDEFRRQLFIAHPELRTRQAEFEPASLGRVNQTLFDKEPTLCLLSYLVTINKVLLFVITRAGDVPTVTIYTLKALDGRPLTQEELNRRLSDFAKRYKNESGVYTSEARELYKILLHPAEAALAGKAHMVIVPDGILNTLPFHILMNERGRHLIEERGVSYAPSITALVEMVGLADQRRGEPVGPQTFFAMGRRTFPDHPEFIKQELPWAEEQVAGIARLFSAKAYTKEVATKANALAEMGKAKYVHFSTHAELNNVMPMYSAVVLGKGPNDDGMLYARELSEMRLKADLVVLSACETGLGQQVSGEGLLGLTWALFAGGAPSSVVTQWKVQDQSMTELMLEFYGQMRKPARGGRPVSKAEALRQAQLKLFRPNGTGAYKHPYHWGGAILVGDWR